MKKTLQILIIFFLIPVFALSVLSIVLPSHQISAEEKRALRQRPALLTETLISGQYTRDFEEFFSDQFPFRQFFIGVHHQIMEWVKLPISDVLLYEGPGEDLGEGETLEPDPSDLITQAPVPTVTPLPTKPAGPTPSPSPTPEPSPTQPPEAVTPTNAPTPTAEAPSVDGKVTRVSAVIIVNDTAMELYYFSESRNRRYTELVSRLQEKLPDTRVFNLMAPTSVEFNSPEKYHDLSSSQKNSIQYIYDHVSDAVITVDAYDQILRHCTEYLYFRTDHHWTARGAYYAYRAFASTAGHTPIELADFTRGELSGTFLGSLYNYTKSSILRNNPDTVEYFLPTVEVEGKAFKSVSMNTGYVVQAVYTKIGSTNKYLIFTGGDNPLIQFKTSLTNGKKLLVIKDSFGNALVPFLLNHYQEVYVMDPRNLDASIPDFVAAHGIQDVLVTNYSFGASNVGWNNGFEDMIR